MTPLAWFQLALGLTKLANWAAKKVDEATWKQAGRLEAMAEQTAAINRAMAIRAKTETETRGLSPEEIIRDLDGNHQLRD